jgi:hypothetical protein
MIAIRVRQDNFPGELYDPVERNAIFGKLARGDKEALVSQKLRAFFAVIAKVARHNALETLSALLRDRVPEFGRSKVDIVDRVEICIFDVPGNCGTFRQPRPSA